jgi:uncharacterized protein YdeI (YjbR/CyaY-like superfamily)
VRRKWFHHEGFVELLRMEPGVATPLHRHSGEIHAYKLGGSRQLCTGEVIGPGVSTKPVVNEAAVIAFRDAAEFEAWLVEHAGLQAGVWLKIAKKGSGVPSLTSDEAVDVGLCFGWISGQRKPLDEVCYLQKYVPRRPGSRWSRVNVEKVVVLVAAGRMQASGLAEVEAAKADGRWAAAYESQRNATVPPDLAAALAASPQAAQAFDALGKTQQYAVILKLLTARNATTRAAQLRKAMAALEGHRRSH